MKKRRWTTEEKLVIVLEGFRGERQIAEICRKHQISQTMYYRWRDRFLEGGTKALADYVEKAKATGGEAKIKVY